LGETLEHAVVREAAEETGLRVKVVKLLEIVDRIILERDELGETEAEPSKSGSTGDRIKYHYVIADYLCELEHDQQPTSASPSSDATELNWCAQPELAQYKLRSALLQILEKCLLEAN
jgi:8-oxo-dGTP pyrophosphatase MutT (NUDIX family)